jgi:hypothetical protein
LTVAAGCSGQSGFLTGGPTVGQLKTNLSHLEYENDQLKRQVAKLERENRSIEDRLVQEQIDNGDLSARLDDARNLIRDRGLGSEARLGSHRGDDDSRAPASQADDQGMRPRTLPAGQSTRKRRKPPFARIPGQVDVLPPVWDDNEPRRDRDTANDRSDVGQNDAERQSFRVSRGRWFPIAASIDNDPARVR